MLSAVGVFGWLNLRVLHLTPPVGLLAISLAASLVTVAVHHIFPGLNAADGLSELLRDIDFSKAVLSFILSFLMFAAGMSIDVTALRGTAWTAAILATAGTIVSTLLIGLSFYLLTGPFGLNLSLLWCFTFGALISPTDPAAMLASIRSVPLPGSVKALLQAESAFNDGVGIVLFTALVAGAVGTQAIELAPLARDVVLKGGGAAVLGTSAAIVVVRAMRKVDDYGVETTLTIALATGVYALCEHMAWSGPVGTAAAGLIVGTDRAKAAMSELTQRYVRGFWKLVDEILNAVLFLLIGLEVIVLRFDWKMAGVALLVPALVIGARFIAIAGPAALLARSREAIGYWIVPVLAWGGVRGALSIALALMLPARQEASVILTCTYATVLFAIFGQSTTLPALVRRMGIADQLSR